MISYNQPSSYDLWLNKRAKSKIPRERWLEIAGDHERRLAEGYPSTLYEQKTGFPTRYTTQIGNVLLIHCSDMGQTTARWDADAFNWWREQVINNQDKIIFVFSHAGVYGTTRATTTSGWHINDTYRSQIQSVLENYHVDAWFHGDIHYKSRVNGVFVDSIVKRFGTVFVNVSCVSGGCGRSADGVPCPEVADGTVQYSTYRVLTLTEGSRDAKIQMRVIGRTVAPFSTYELLHEWYDPEEYHFTLSKDPVGLPELPVAPTVPTVERTFVVIAVLLIIVVVVVYIKRRQISRYLRRFLQV
jgi:hypothetical protein